MKCGSSTKYILELTKILISPDGSNDLPHFAMLIRLYDNLLTFIVFNNPPCRGSVFLSHIRSNDY